MPKGKEKKVFGIKPKKIRKAGQIIHTSGKVADFGGKELMKIGKATGDKRLLAVGTGISVGGKVLEKSGSVLKKTKGKRKKKK